MIYNELVLDLECLEYIQEGEKKTSQITWRIYFEVSWIFVEVQLLLRLRRIIFSGLNWVMSTSMENVFMKTEKWHIHYDTFSNLFFWIQTFIRPLSHKDPNFKLNILLTVQLLDKWGEIHVEWTMILYKKKQPSSKL